MSPSPLTLETLGWNAELEKQFAPYRGNQLVPGRVVVEDKHHYVVFCQAGTLRAQIAGKLLHANKNQAALPKVGDWVALIPHAGEDKAIIHQVLPRTSSLSRKIPGRETTEQMLVTNVDTAFVVQALDQTYNPRLIERFLLMVIEGGIQPVVVLNKCDLCREVDDRVAEAQRRAGAAPVVAVSGKTGKNIKRLEEWINPQKTVVFIGISGVGKSTIINRLYGDEVAATTEVRESDGKGRHTTSWRELIVLPKGGLVIDTPGMREFHLWFGGNSIPEAFPDIIALAAGCKFRDCTHTAENACAVKAAIASGEFPAERYQSYLKLQRELAYLDKASHWHDRKKTAGRPRDHLAHHEDDFEP